jgi:hypothetical protein
MFILVYYAFYALNKKIDPFLDRVLAFVVVLDFYLSYQIIVFSDVHEKYGPRGPPLILREYDPVLGITINRTTYPLEMNGQYYQAVLALEQIKHIILQHIFAIFTILTVLYAVHIATKKFMESTEGRQ